MPGEGFRERDVTANGLRLHLLEGPDGGRPPLLLVHGIYDRWETWETVLPALVADYHVVAPDLRGHARSDWPARGYRLVDYAADAVGVLDALGIARADVVGHSLGALIAATLAAEAPQRVRAVVLEDPPAELSDASRGRMAALLAAKRLPEGETYAALCRAYPARTEADLRRMTGWLRGTADGPFVALIERLDGATELYPTLERIAAPVLVLQADPAREAALSDAAAARCLAALRHGALERFPDTGHGIHVERPEPFVSAVLPFLRDAATA